MSSPDPSETVTATDVVVQPSRKPGSQYVLPRDEAEAAR